MLKFVKNDRSQFNLDLGTINASIKLGETLSNCSQDIVRTRNSDINQGP